MYENSAVIVCVKPAGVLSQTDSRGGESMVSLLSEQTGGDIFPVHRLDIQTGGIMVYAKTAKAASELSRQIASGEFKKEYLAVIHGAPEKKEDFLSDLLFKDSAKNKSYVVKRERKGVKKAELEYTLIESAEERIRYGFSFHTADFRLPETGNTALKTTLINLDSGRIKYALKILFQVRKQNMYVLLKI